MPIPGIAETAALGARIARLLDERVIPTRLIVRNPVKASRLKHAEVAISLNLLNDE